MKKILLILLAILVVILIGVGIVALSVMADIKGTSRDGQLCQVTIPQGASVTQIAEILEEAGAVDSALTFRIYSKLNADKANYKYGTYEFYNNIGFEKIAEILSTQGQKAQTVRVTIPEGTTLHNYTKNVNGKDVTVIGIGTILEKAGVCKANDFFEELQNVDFTSELLSGIDKENTYFPLEGYLFADTYEFYFCGCVSCAGNKGKEKTCESKACAQKAIKRMIDRTEEIITDDMIKNAEDMGYTIHEMLTLASIIQLESGIDTEEMPNVSAVFHNRLNKPAYFPMLGSSPTIYYDKSMGGDGRYDTQRVAKGLPPGPVCSSGRAAIEAAFMPTENFDYTYFVTDNTGKFYYNSTESGHNATIKKLQNEGKWINEKY